MQILQTPDAAADGLPGYDFERRYVTVPSGDGQDIRVHLVDEGDPDARPVVFLHGNPSWSYLWREQIRAASEAGLRALAPDLVGMGMSDKPSEMSDYTVARHVEWIRALLFDRLELEEPTLVLHDWGGVIGMRIAAAHPDRVAAMAISNTGLPRRDMSEPLPESVEATGPYADFQAFAAAAPWWEPWSLLPMVMATEPPAELVDAYRAPYPQDSLTVGSRAFTQLLPTRPDSPMYADNDVAWQALERFDKPVATILSDRDLVAPDGWKPIVERIPGAAGQPHVILEGGGHFLQEEIPVAYTDALMAWLADTAKR